MATETLRKRGDGAGARTEAQADRKAAASRRTPRKPRLLTFTTPEERRRMIEETAYYKAASRGFEGGDPVQDWCEAESEIDARLAARK